MEITKELIQHVAKTARITLTKQEEQQFLKDFQDILNTFSTIDQCDVTKTQSSFLPTTVENNTKEDTIQASLPTNQALAKRKNKDCFFIGPQTLKP